MQTDNLQKYLKTTLNDIKKQKEKIESLNSLPKVNVRGFSEFFIDSPVTMSYQFSHQIMNLQNQSVYLSLYERNTNFNKLPNHKNTRLVGNQIIFQFDTNLTGEISGTVFFIFYDDKKMLESVTFELSERVVEDFKAPNKAVSFRVALKLEGTGTFRNNEISIEQRTVYQYVTSVDKGTIVEKKNSSLAKQSAINEFKYKIKNFKYKRKVRDNNLTVAAILDEFSYECFKYDCNLIKLSKENWKNQLVDLKPDFLFVESCWQGNNGDWAYEVANLHKNAHRVSLKELSEYCKVQGIKTVFWDKEGYENFDFFKEASKYFDIILTADETNIENFKNYTQNDNVHALAFAAQPQIHNPIYKNRNYLGQLAFAGSYYGNKHDLRKKDMENIIKPALKHDIQIFDRYFGSDPQKFPNNQWPEDYKDNIVGKLNYNEMVEAYKNYDMFINVNSVQNSRFMFARRVFEVLASKTMVLSGPSIGVEEMFEGLVPIAATEEQANHYLRIYLKNAALREKTTKEASRFVFKHHTYKNRLQEICDLLGINKNVVSVPKATIISATNRDEFIDNLYDSISHQTYPNLEIVIILNDNNMDIKKWKTKFNDLNRDVQIIQVDEEHSLGYCLNKAIENSSGEIISKFDDDDYYAPEYLTDMVISMDYSNADLVGKSSHYIYFENNDLLALKTIGSGIETYSDFVAGATLVFKKEVYQKLEGFSDRNRGEDSDFLKRAKENGFILYSNDQYNYCCLRRKNKENHTWKIDDEDLLRNSTSNVFTKDFKTPVTL
jgi:hypothetical protein